MLSHKKYIYKVAELISHYCLSLVVIMLPDKHQYFYVNYQYNLIWINIINILILGYFKCYFLNAPEFVKTRPKIETTHFIIINRCYFSRCLFSESHSCLDYSSYVKFIFYRAFRSLRNTRRALLMRASTFTRWERKEGH